MNNKWNTSLLLSLLVAWLFSACTKSTVDFYYTPKEPRAGQVVRFTNTSDTGEEWLWNFGDNTTSTSKSPSKTYKKAGTYTVTLKVDNKKFLTRTQTITVYDTVPGIAIASDSIDSIGSIGMFRETTFAASVYNPYGYTLAYRWLLNPEHVVVLSDNLESSSVKVLFRQPLTDELVRLLLTINGKEDTVRTTVNVLDQPASALLIRTGTDDYRQRIYGQHYEDYHPTATTGDKALLDAANETETTYNGQLFTLASVSSLTGDEVLGFRITNRKIYYRTASGLFVCSVTGANKVAIDVNHAPTALVIDRVDDRLFWAAADSIYAMQLIQSENNQYKTTPAAVNDLTGVTSMAIDETQR